VPLIKQIIYMGGAIDVAGNTTQTAEFNWWFDPDAAQEVVRLPIPQVVVPLDVTDTVLLTKAVYDRIAHPAQPTAVTQVYQQLNGYGFDGKNGFETNPSLHAEHLGYLDPGLSASTPPMPLKPHSVMSMCWPSPAQPTTAARSATPTQPSGAEAAEDDGGARSSTTHVSSSCMSIC
jgi:hypothetical protein